MHLHHLSEHCDYISFHMYVNPHQTKKNVIADLSLILPSRTLNRSLLRSQVFSLPPSSIILCFLLSFIGMFQPHNSFCLLLLPSILGEVHRHALIGLEPSNYLSNDIGCFSEILTPADAGACQEVFYQTHPDVITPKKERENNRDNVILFFLTVEEKYRRKNFRVNCTL